MKNIPASLLSIVLLSCFISCKNEKAARIDRLLSLAWRSDSTLDFTTAIKYYDSVLSLDSSRWVALMNRGRILVLQGKTAAGFNDLDKAVRLRPAPQTFECRGISYMTQRNFELAERDFNKEIELDPKFSGAYYGLSLINSEENNLETAERLCNIADSISYDANHSHHIRAEIYQKGGNYMAAINELNQAIKIDRTNADDYNNRGLNENNIGNYQAAIIDFDKAIRLDSKLAFAYNNKALALLQLNHIDEAMQAVNASLQLNDSNAYAYQNRAKIYEALHAQEKACADLKKAALLARDAGLLAEIRQQETHCK